MTYRILPLLLTVLLAAPWASAREKVRVLGYVFPPFVNADKHTGLTFELIDLLNSSQDDYWFSFELSSPNRRYLNFNRSQADLILYEMPEWEWQQYNAPVSTSSVLYEGGEVFIALKKPGRDQHYFDQLQGKQIAIFQGYHYQFADLKSDTREIRKRFDVLVTNKHQQLIELVERGRADLAIVTQSYLLQQLKINPELKDRLLISDRYDQHYRLRALLADKATLDIKTLEKLLQKLRNNGSYTKMLNQYGLTPPALKTDHQ